VGEGMATAASISGRFFVRHVDDTHCHQSLPRPNPAAEKEVGGVEHQLSIEPGNPTEGLEKDELRRRIDEAMTKLTPAHRLVLVLHEYEGMEYKEIAKKVGISIGTVMSRLFYARRRLATLLRGLQRERDN
jgi:RNA polymerase sigma factor (sigma-70 family)